jgi:hypothetical protein
MGRAGSKRNILPLSEAATRAHHFAAGGDRARGRAHGHASGKGWRVVWRLGGLFDGGPGGSVAERRTAIDVPLEVINKIEQEKEEIIRH